MKLSNANKKLALQACNKFSGLSSDAIGLLAATTETEIFQEGEKIFSYGETSDRAYVIVSGEVDIYLPSLPQPVRTLANGELFGEYGLFANERSASVKAKTEAVLLSIEYSRFRACLFEAPQVMYRLFELAVNRLIELEKSKS
jgi:CRP-like cAMP-binding protein